MDNNTAEKLMEMSNEKKLQIVKKALPTIDELMSDKAFRDSVSKATGSRFSHASCLSVLNAMTNIEILRELKKLNENISALLPDEEIEEVEDKKKKK